MIFDISVNLCVIYDPWMGGGILSAYPQLLMKQNLDN